MYIAASHGQTIPREQSFDVNRNLLPLWSFATSLKIIFFWNLILCNFFHDFIHVYSPGAGADNPLGTKFWCQQEHLVTLVICLQVKKKSLWSLILYIFFHDLIHVYSPGAGADSPQGTKFWCQQKGLITLPICCKFQRNLFEVWFYAFFFLDLIHVYSPGAGSIQPPRGQSFHVNRNFLSLRSSVARFKS